MMRLGSLLHLHFNSLLILDQLVGVFSITMYLELLGHILQCIGAAAAQQMTLWEACINSTMLHDYFLSSLSGIFTFVDV